MHGVPFEVALQARCRSCAAPAGAGQRQWRPNRPSPAAYGLPRLPNGRRSPCHLTNGASTIEDLVLELDVSNATPQCRTSGVGAEVLCQSRVICLFPTPTPNIEEFTVAYGFIASTHQTPGRSLRRL